MGYVECCHHCVAPKRYPGCHDHCPEYLEVKKKLEEKRDANMIAYGLRRHKDDVFARMRKRSGRKNV